MLRDPFGEALGPHAQSLGPTSEAASDLVELVGFDLFALPKPLRETLDLGERVEQAFLLGSSHHPCLIDFTRVEERHRLFRNTRVPRRNELVEPAHAPGET